jgi:glycine/D-amino acid oxidase-like deaminating enzyme
LLVVGAGYTGLSCALHASDTIDDIVVIDQAQPGWGCSGRNGGQVNPQWKPSLGRIRQLFAGEDFGRFIDILDQSAGLVFDLIDRYAIECQALRSGSVLATRGKKGKRYLADWSRFWREYGADVELLDAGATRRLIGSSAYDSCLLDRRGGSLQPLSYARGLARACQGRGVTLFGDTRALRAAPRNDGWLVSTPGGRIGCSRLVIGTNGYTDKLWPGLAQSIIPVASMITATRPLPEDIAAGILPGRQCVAEFAGVPPYYRIDESNRMVFGWRGTLSGGIGSLDTRHLQAEARRIFPQLKGIEWEYDWAGYVGITSHQRPMLVRLGDNAYAGLGYNGRGITMATMMGKQLWLQLSGRQTGIALEKLQRVPMHALYPAGVTARIVSGHISDFLRR